MYQATPAYPQTLSYEVKHEEKYAVFWFQTWKFQKPSQKLHFGVTKNDTCLIFHIHVLNLFKSWSNLGFDQDSNGHKNSK
jgi:hypothetical protein